MNETTACNHHIDNSDAPYFDTSEFSRMELCRTAVTGRVFEDLANKASDIGHGVASILAMLEFNIAQKMSGDRPLMDGYEEGRLIRLAIRASSMLGANSDEALISQARMARKVVPE